MYGDPEEAEKARQKKHMTMQEAAQIAKEADTKELWLTHYSPAMNWPDNYRDAVRAIFDRAHISRDGRSKELNFED